jgi:hypothetical protein
MCLSAEKDFNSDLRAGVLGGGGLWGWVVPLEQS